MASFQDNQNVILHFAAARERDGGRGGGGNRNPMTWNAPHKSLPSTVRIFHRPDARPIAQPTVSVTTLKIWAIQSTYL